MDWLSARSGPDNDTTATLIVTATLKARDQGLTKLLLLAYVSTGVFHPIEAAARRQGIAPVERTITALGHNSPASVSRPQSRVRVLASRAKSSWAHLAVRTSVGLEPLSIPIVHPDAYSSCAGPAFTGCGRAPPFLSI